MRDVEWQSQSLYSGELEQRFVFEWKYTILSTWSILHERQQLRVVVVLWTRTGKIFIYSHSHSAHIHTHSHTHCPAHTYVCMCISFALQCASFFQASFCLLCFFFCEHSKRALATRFLHASFIHVMRIYICFCICIMLASCLVTLESELGQSPKPGDPSKTPKAHNGIHKDPDYSQSFSYWQIWVIIG